MAGRAGTGAALHPRAVRTLNAGTVAPFPGNGGMFPALFRRAHVARPMWPVSAVFRARPRRPMPGPEPRPPVSAVTRPVLVLELRPPVPVFFVSPGIFSAVKISPAPVRSVRIAIPIHARIIMIPGKAPPVVMGVIIPGARSQGKHEGRHHKYTREYFHRAVSLENTVKLMLGQSRTRHLTTR